jgi:hypothetical protein
VKFKLMTSRNSIRLLGLSIGLLGLSLIGRPLQNIATAQKEGSRRQEPMPVVQGQPAIDYLNERGLFLGLAAAIDKSRAESRQQSVDGRSSAGNYEYAIALREETAIVGVYGGDSRNDALYFYERGRNGADEWVEVKRLMAGADESALSATGTVTRVLRGAGLLPDPALDDTESRFEGGRGRNGALQSQEVGLNPNEVYIQSISYGGTGCPQGSVGSSFANDRQSATLIFDSFVASSGPGVPVTESRKNCQIDVNLHVPQGFTFSTGTVDYRGYVQLPAGVSAEQKSVYYFQGEQAQNSSGTIFTGPVAKDYLASDKLPLTTFVPEECGAVRPVNINAQVRLTGNLSQSSQITTDSIDGKITHILGLRWRRC